MTHRTFVGEVSCWTLDGTIEPNAEGVRAILAALIEREQTMSEQLAELNRRVSLWARETELTADRRAEIQHQIDALMRAPKAVATSNGCAAD